MKQEVKLGATEKVSWPSLTILLTSYNKSAYLEESLKFVRQMLDLGCEVVIVDDGSTDGSLEKIEEFRKTNPKLVLESQENSGSAEARNNALKKATREYILFMDFDDSVNVEILESGLSIMTNSGIDLGMFNYQTMPMRKVSVLNPAVSKPKKIDLESMRDEIYESMGYWRYLYRKKFAFDSKLVFTPTFKEVGGYFILDDMFWLLHNSSLTASVIIFPNDWILYNYSTEESPNRKGWKRFQQQAMLMPQASEVFLEKLKACNHKHDDMWLGKKVNEVTLNHIKMLYLSQSLRIIGKYFVFLIRWKKYLQIKDNIEVLEIIKSAVISGGKNSIYLFLTRSKIGNKLIRVIKNA